VGAGTRTTGRAWLARGFLAALGLLVASGFVSAAPVTARLEAPPNVKHLPPDCLPDTRLGDPGRVRFVVWCSVRPGKLHFEIEAAPGTRFTSIPAHASVGGEGAHGEFHCLPTGKGARCAGYVGGPLTIRGDIGVAPGHRCDPVRVRTHFLNAGGAPLGCPGVRGETLRPRRGYYRGFRLSVGLDPGLRHKPAVLERRIDRAIANWRRGEPVARVTNAEVGAPLLPREQRVSEFRDELLDITVDALERWVPDHADDTYAGYTLDTSGFPIIRVGFTGDQAAQLAAFKRQADLFAPSRVQGFLVAPEYSESQLDDYEEQVIAYLESKNGSLINSVGRGLAPDKVEIGTEHVAKVKQLLLGMFGTLDPFLVSFEQPAELL
jgi:hypothetical protein